MRIDPNRQNRRTGIYVRAQTGTGDWMSVDLSQLDRNSLMEWLRSRGGDNPWAEETVAILLGHNQGAEAE